VSIIKICERCEKKYHVPPSRASRSRFCCKTCFDITQTTREVKSLQCETCGETFAAPMDHGKWPRYCSRKCFGAGTRHPIEKPCAHCGQIFIAERSHHLKDEDGRRKFCSKQCYSKSMLKKEPRTCLWCQEVFFTQPSRDDTCCSLECRNEFYVLDRSHGWKGGEYIQASSGDKMVRSHREGYVSPYVGEHRIIAGEVVGRQLARYEYVIHISGEHDDNSPDNLFICASISEYAKIRNGSLPWPTRSNLSTYRDREDAA
jgi:hypothetical protein